MFFLSYCIFFETFNLFVVFAVFLLCSLPCCFGCVTGVFSCLVRFFRRPNLTNVLLCWLIFFAVLLILFLMSYGACLLCCFFFCGCPPWLCVSKHAPRDLPCPCTPTFSCPLYHTTPMSPKQPMCNHLRPPLTRACTCHHDRVFLYFCVLVACTVCVRMCVFGLAGVYVSMFCVCLCV